MAAEGQNVHTLPHFTSCAGCYEGPPSSRDLEKSFLDMMHNSGYPNIKLEKKIDFTKLYLERFN